MDKDIKINQYTDVKNKKHSVSHLVIPDADSEDKERLINELYQSLLNCK